MRSCTKPSIYFFFTFSRRTFLLFLNLKLENYSVFTFLLFLDLKLENYYFFTFLLFLDLKLENYYFFTFLLFLDLKLENYSVFTFLLFLDLQDRSNYSELAMELMRSCTKPSIYFFFTFSRRTFLLFLNLKLENYSVFTFLLFLDLKLEYYSVFTFLLFLDLQDCSNSSELAIGLLQSCTKPSISFFFTFSRRTFLLLSTSS